MDIEVNRFRGAIVSLVHPGYPDMPYSAIVSWHAVSPIGLQPSSFGM